MARLICDYTEVNPALVAEYQSLPDLEDNLDRLRGKYYFSTLDNRQGFYSVKLAEESKKYTRFLTGFGAYKWGCLPTGLNLSPNQYNMHVEKAVSSEVLQDKDTNEVLWEKEDLVQLRDDRLPGVLVYLDDIVIATELKPTLEESLKCHMELLEKVISRFHFHGVKLSFNKCKFFLS